MVVNLLLNNSKQQKPHCVVNILIQVETSVERYIIFLLSYCCLKTGAVVLFSRFAPWPPDTCNMQTCCEKETEGGTLLIRTGDETLHTQFLPNKIKILWH